MAPPVTSYGKIIPPRASPSHLSAQCHSTILTVTASLPDNHLESAYKYLSPRLDPHTAGIASDRRLRRCKKVKSVKKFHLGVYGHEMHEMEMHQTLACSGCTRLQVVVRFRAPASCVIATADFFAEHDATRNLVPCHAKSCYVRRARWIA